jgi:signal transduction histidine kinase
VSRVTRGKLRLKTQTMDLNEGLARAIEAARPLFEERRQQFEASVASGPLQINGDPTRITQVLVNLLNNAAKYTPEGGRIEVASFAQSDNAVVRVKDTGIGIAPHTMEHIFDLFAQGERSLDRAAGGLGIGLTLARRIVTMHGGDIIARSEGVGRGSEFEVKLPMMRTP